jgi:glucan phosphoethanolaminetransferase (alkaline phosphatase superfamily)
MSAAIVLKFLSRTWSDAAIRGVFWLSMLITGFVNVPYYLSFTSHRGLALAAAISASFISALSFFLALTLHRYLLYFVMVPILVACAMAGYFLHELGVCVNENTLGLVYETNYVEARDLASPRLIALGILALLVGAFYARRVADILPRSKTARRSTWAAGLFALHLAAALCSRTIEVYDPPLGFLTNSYVYWREKARVAELLRSRRDISTNAELTGLAVNEPLTVIFVIGESVRPDHLHINGYPRPTTPNIERLGVVSFPDVSACAANTRFAVPCLMTRATRDDMRRPYLEKSFISVFRQLEFETTWISMQGQFLEAIVPDEYTVAATAAIAKESKFVTYLNPTGDVGQSKRFDTEMLPALDEALARAGERKLIVLHTAGAHFHYDSRYPESSIHYSPLCEERSPAACDLKALNNSYDNAMHFLDDFLGQVISRVVGKNALLVYVSDHGESLGEGGHYLHHLHSDEPEQNRVAMLAWASDEFRWRHTAAWNLLSRSANKRLAHDHVFHSMLDCVGIEMAELDPSLSVCSNSRERDLEFAPNRLSLSFDADADADSGN